MGHEQTMSESASALRRWRNRSGASWGFVRAVLGRLQGRVGHHTHKARGHRRARMIRARLFDIRKAADGHCAIGICRLHAVGTVPRSMCHACDVVHLMLCMRISGLRGGMTHATQPKAANEYRKHQKERHKTRYDCTTADHKLNHI